MQKPETRSPFQIFDHFPPQGFKILTKRKASPVHKKSAKKNRLSDGFSAEEARPSPFGRRRRLHHLDSDIKSLELTQKAVTSQQTQRSTRRDIEKKSHSHTNTTFGQRRHYFGTSLFDVEFHDPVESFEMKPEEAEDEDSPPTTVSIHSSQESAENDIHFITIPQTDTPEPTKPEESRVAAPEWNGPRAFGRAENQLPPKRILSTGFEDSDGLSLRPGSLSWLRGVTRISDTPPLSDATRPCS